MATSNSVAKPVDIRTLIGGESMKKQFALALPKICTPERFVRVALTALNKNPKIANCTKESLLSCLMTCAELGIEPDSRRAHLIPYGNSCTLIIDYKGKVELAMRSGMIANIHADKICENDIFEYNKGIVEKHTIDFKADRGKTYAFYCVVRFKDGTEKSEVMTLKEIQAIKARSKAGNSGPWITDFDEMAKKTVFHRVSKWIPQSPELRDLEEKEHADGTIIPDIDISTIPEATVVPEKEPEPVAQTGLSGMAAAAAQEGK